MAENSSRKKSAAERSRGDRAKGGADRSRAGGRGPRFEQLEDRILLSADGGACAPVVELIEADNRGRILVHFDQELQSNTALDQRAVQILTAGEDNLFGTDDDLELDVFAAVQTFDRSLLFVNADVPANERYQVRLNSEFIISKTGLHLDGEFNGAGVATGDGVEGGDLKFFVQRSARTIARITTNIGIIDIELFEQQASISVANFLNYADTARYDNTFFHRSVASFVLQGGGFVADPGLDVEVEVDPPIQNEFGISNTRGTLAFAKRGGDQNSATSQFFFNIGDNGGNLDSQNGGFTVFAQVIGEDGLALMDEINDLMTVNASSFNAALTDLPVRNNVTNGDDVRVGDLVVVERIALLLDPVANVPGELDAPSMVFSSDTSAATVQIFDLSGQGLDGIDEMVQVRFSRNGVSSITLRDGFRGEGIGIAITGVSSVGSIKDARRNDISDISFIVSTARINSINLKGNVTGANLNGLVFGGTLLPADIDGDGRRDDLTGILVMNGSASSITVRGDVAGDIMLPDGVRSLRIMGQLRNSSVNIGGDALITRQAKIQFGRVRDVQFSSSMMISSLTAVDWRGSTSSITAPAFNTIQIKGDRRAGVDGDLQADITTTGMNNRPITINKLDVTGQIVGAEITTPADLGQVTARGGLTNSRINAGRDIRRITAGRVSNTFVNAGGEIGPVSVTDWLGGELNADLVSSIQTKGDRRAGVDGDLAIDINIQNNAQRPVAIRAIKVKGDLFNSDIVTSGNGGVKSFVVGGDVDDAFINVAGDINSFTSREVSDTDLRARVLLKSVRVTSWEGGQIRAGFVGKIDVKGDRRSGEAGDFSGDIVTQQVTSMKVAGDLRDALIDLNRPVRFNEMAIRSLDVKGDISNVELRSTSDIGSISANAVSDSTIYAGINDNTEQFPRRNRVVQPSSIGRILIRGGRDGMPSYSNSYIAAFDIGGVTLGLIDTNNSTAAFGLAAQNIDRLFYNAEDVIARFTRSSQLQTAQVHGDFEFRAGFLLPDTA